jgi:hypothetical protein
VKVLLGAMVVALVASTFASAATPRTGILQTFSAEVAAFNTGDWRALWNLHTPRFRAKCNYSRYSAAERRARRGARILRVENVRVEMLSASRATISYTLVFAHGGRPVTNAGDAFAQVLGRWLDDYEANTGCGY